MANLYDDVDIVFTTAGDFDLGSDGDFKDTSGDTIDALKQQLMDIAASASGDWEIYPDRGASLNDFVGEPNNRLTAEAIHDRLKVSIISAGIVVEEDLEIRIIPVHIHRLLILIRVRALSTPTNSISDDQLVTVKLVYDLIEQGVHFFEKTPELISS